jgi:succinate dehydrogenase / fumarate reductase, iron-sulfur subunit
MADKATLQIYRGTKDGGEIKPYEVETFPGMVVLDAVHEIQAKQSPDLAVRWNCKAGRCGSCSAEINGKPRLMCMTRMTHFAPGEPITVTPMRAFPIIKDLVTDVSHNFEMAKKIPAFKPKPPEKDGTWRMQQEDIERIQEFRKCIECFLCQDVCHVIRDHDKKDSFAGPRFMIALAGLDMHPLDTLDRHELLKKEFGVGLCNITRCCTEVCPESIGITDNAIIPLKERVADDYYDPIRMLLRKVAGGPKKTVARLPRKPAATMAATPAAKKTEKTE